MKDNEIRKIELTIGYVFNNKELLIRAFTHRSVLIYSKTQSYEKLEFLGDAILDFVVAEYLCRKYFDMNEGDLTKLRAKIVSRNPLSLIIRNMDLMKYMVFGNGSYEDAASDKVYCDLYEAIVAAIYIDSNIDNARNFILKSLALLLNDKELLSLDDTKTRLQEYCQAAKVSLRYEQTDMQGPPHNPHYVYEVYVNGEMLGRGEGKTKKMAEQYASSQAIINLKNENKL
jgi:ribonuclease-3